MSTPSTIRVDLGGRGYDVRIEDGGLDRAHDHLAPFARDGRLVVVSDETVWAAQGERLRRGLAPIDVVPMLVPPGEWSKGWSELTKLIDRFSEAGVERGDTILAFGGGMVGDLAGFAASIFKRGIGFVQLPTSLLAQVDGSVGGKTAINVYGAKNLVGAFHQPALVLIDPSCLDTLPERHVRAGYAEIVKYALIADDRFFAWLEAHGAALIAGDPQARGHAIATAVAGKAWFVEQDERETSGTRALLNLGHTFGHALEADFGFDDRLLHGEAVALGMVLAFRFAAELGLGDQRATERVATHLRAVGLPVTFEEAGLPIDPARLAAHMQRDKKAKDGRIRLVLPRAIGEAVLHEGVDVATVADFLERQLAAERELVFQRRLAALGEEGQGGTP